MTYAEIAAVSAAQARASRILARFTIVATILAVPASWAVFRLIQWGGNPFSWPFTWSWEVVRRALVDGTFWQQPLQALFQAPELRIGDEWGQIAASFAFTAAFGYLLVWLLHGVPVLIAASSLGSGISGFVRGQAPLRAPGRLIGMLIPRVAHVRGREVDGIRFDNLGSDLLVSVRVPRQLPELIIDSRANRVERRSSVRFILPAASEIVLDGTTHETSRIYIADAARDAAPVLLPPAVTAIVVKRLANADILVDDRVLTAIVEVREATDPRRVEAIAEAVRDFADALVAQADRLDALPGRSLKVGALRVKAERGVLRWRLWTRFTGVTPTGVILTAAVIVATLLSLAGGRGGSTAELMALGALVGVVVTHGVGRWMRSLLSFDARPGERGAA